MFASGSRDVSFHCSLVGGGERDGPMFRTKHTIFVVPGLARRAGRHVEYVSFVVPVGVVVQAVARTAQHASIPPNARDTMDSMRAPPILDGGKNVLCLV